MLYCSVGPESILLHIFGSCEKLKLLWDIATGVIETITKVRFDFHNLRVNLMLDLVNVRLGNLKKYEKMLAYLNTIINYSIWKMRNEIKHESITFSMDRLVGKIIRSIRARKNVDSKKIPFIFDLSSSFMRESRRYLPIDNG